MRPALLRCLHVLNLNSKQFGGITSLKEAEMFSIESCMIMLRVEQLDVFCAAAAKRHLNPRDGPFLKGGWSPPGSSASSSAQDVDWGMQRVTT